MLTARSFHKALAFVSHAIDPEHQSPGLRGVMFDFTGATLWLVATDGLRMACVECETTAADLTNRYIIGPDQVEYLRTAAGAAPAQGDTPVCFSRDAHRTAAMHMTVGAIASASASFMPKDTKWPDWRAAVNQGGWPQDQELGYPAPTMAAAAVAIAQHFGQTVGLQRKDGPLVLRALELPADANPGVFNAFVVLAPRLVTRAPAVTV